MSIGSIVHSALDVPPTAAQQKAYLERVSAQFDQRQSQGTAEAAAKGVAKDVQSAAATDGVTVTLSSAAQAVNTVAKQALAQSGATFNPGALVTPNAAAAQKADLGKAATEFRHLADKGALEAGVTSFAQTAVDDATEKLSAVG